jgi:acyl dehydratase
MVAMTSTGRVFATPLDLAGAVGERLGVSAWHEIGPDRVDGFARSTGDDQWIHVDAERAAAGPYGGPIVHGFLVLSLVPRLLGEVFEVTDLGLMVNAGVDGVRFLAPVPVGSRLRLVADLESAKPRARGAVEASVAVSFERDDHPAPVARATVTLILRPSRPARRPAVVTPPPAVR